jgi:hypothetical protein
MFMVGAGNFSLHRLVWTGSGARPASCPVGAVGSFSGGWGGRSKVLATRLRLVPRAGV